jgi:hypothetical protein
MVYLDVAVFSGFDMINLGTTIEYGTEEEIGGEFKFQFQNHVRLFEVLQLKQGGLKEAKAYDSEENPKPS